MFTFLSLQVSIIRSFPFSLPRKSSSLILSIILSFPFSLPRKSSSLILRNIDSLSFHTYNPITLTLTLYIYIYIYVFFSFIASLTASHSAILFASQTLVIPNVDQFSDFFVDKKRMDSPVFDNVKAEKESAMRRYRRHQKYKTFMRLFEFFGALVLLSWSSTYCPITAKFLGEFFAPLFSNTYYAFLLGNAIVLSLICMSRRYDAAENSRNDFYDEFVNNSEIRRRISENDDYKQIVCSENAVSPVHSDIVAPVIETVHETDPAVSPINQITVSTVVEKALEVKRYRRTQSESFEPKSIEKSGPELRRSVTENGRELVVTVEEMNSDEFRMTIETFIATRKKIMMEEKRKDQKTEKSSAVSLRDQNRELFKKIDKWDLIQ